MLVRGYLLNFSILIKVISKLKYIRSRRAECVSSLNIISVAILMLMMILLYLFLGVCYYE